MLVDLEEMKQYLRVDTNEDDKLITSLIYSAENLCMNVARLETLEELYQSHVDVRFAILYAVSYLYEHREEADHTALNLSLRALLVGVRKVGF